MTETSTQPGIEDSAQMRPLRGTRVIDLSDESAGLAGRILADLGADVILVEPVGGARTRHLAPFLADEPGPERSCVHQYLNANKRSVVTAEVSVLRRLLQSADVVLHTEPAFAHGDRPGLIEVCVTPFGPSGPRAHWRGGDLIAAAAGGLLWVCGERADPPTHGAAEPSHTMAGLAAATAVLLALRVRDRDPATPLKVDISAQEATQMCVLQTANPTLWRWFDTIPTRPGISGALRCADGGHVGLLVRTDNFAKFLAWLDEVGVPHTMTTDDWELARNLTPSPEHPVGAATLGLAARLTRDQFVQGAFRANVVCLPMLDFSELAQQEQYQANGQFFEVEHEAPEVACSLGFLRSPVDTADATLPIRRAPLLGEHTREVLDALEDGRQPVLRGRRSKAPMDPTRALEGVRVVDFGWVLAAPIGTRLLASFGADVIRVESTRKPDSMRSQLGPDRRPDPDLGGLFNDVNAGKRSLAVDLGTDRGREVVARLVATSDVVVNNFRPGALERMGFGFDRLREWKRDIVSLNLPGAHRRGPWSQRSSMGNILMAASGFNSLMGFPDRPPRGLGIAYPDFTSPYLLATTIIAALRDRDVTGEGRELHLAQLSSMVSLLGVPWMHYHSTGRMPARPGNRDPNHCPHGVFRCSGEEEWCALAVRDDAEFVALCGLLGRPELATDARFATHAARKKNEDELERLLSDWTSTLDSWDVAERCQAAGVRAAPVENLADLMDRDDHAMHHYQTVRQPTRPEVEIPIDAECIRFRGWRHLLQRAPRVGEHSEEIVRGLLGYSDEEYVGMILDDILV